MRDGPDHLSREKYVMRVLILTPARGNESIAMCA